MRTLEPSRTLPELTGEELLLAAIVGSPGTRGCIDRELSRRARMAHRSKGRDIDCRLRVGVTRERGSLPQRIAV